MNSPPEPKEQKAPTVGEIANTMGVAGSNVPDVIEKAKRVAEEYQPGQVVDVIQSNGMVSNVLILTKYDRSTNRYKGLVISTDNPLLLAGKSTVRFSPDMINPNPPEYNYSGIGPIPD